MAVAEAREAVVEAWDLMDRYGRSHRNTHLVNGWYSEHEASEMLIDDETDLFVSEYLAWLRSHHWQVYYALRLHFIGDKLKKTDENGCRFDYYEPQTLYQIGIKWQRSEKWARDRVYQGVDLLQGWLSHPAQKRLKKVF